MAKSKKSKQHRAAKEAERVRKAAARKALEAERKHDFNRDNQINKTRSRKREERDWQTHAAMFPDGLLACKDELCGWEGEADEVLGENAEHRNRAQVLHDAECPGCGATGTLLDKLLTLLELGERQHARHLAEEIEAGTADPERRAFERTEAWLAKWDDVHMPGQAYPFHARGFTRPPSKDEQRAGHPAVKARLQRKRIHPDLDEDERERRRLARYYDRTIRDAEADGEGAPAIKLLVDSYVPQVQQEHDLLGGEHAAALASYLYDVIPNLIFALGPVGPWYMSRALELICHGDILGAARTLEEGVKAEIPRYSDWREQSRERVLAHAA